MFTLRSPWLAGIIFWNLSLDNYFISLPLLRYFYDSVLGRRDDAQMRLSHSSTLTEGSVWLVISWMARGIFQQSVAKRASAIFGSSAKEWLRHPRYAVKEGKMRRGSTVLFTAIMLTLTSPEGNWAQRTVPKVAPGTGNKGEGTRQCLCLLLFPFPSLPFHLSSPGGFHALCSPMNVLSSQTESQRRGNAHIWMHAHRNTLANV